MTNVILYVTNTIAYNLPHFNIICFKLLTHISKYNNIINYYINLPAEDENGQLEDSLRRAQTPHKSQVLQQYTGIDFN